MALKSSTELKTDISNLKALVTLVEVQSILTDMVDSLGGGGGGLALYGDPTEAASLAAGDNNIAHSLDISVYKVFVYNSAGTTVAEPDFTITDSDNTIIHWVGPTWSSPLIYFLAVKS